MTRHGYPPSALLGDYLRAMAGFIPTVAVLIIAPVGAVSAAVLGGFAALFGVFGVRTALRHYTRIELTEAALWASGLPRACIPWNELDRMMLSHYSTYRDGRGGWMQLELRAGASTLRIDSRIEGFSELVSASAAAAEMRGLLLDPATSANLAALGVNLRAAIGSQQGRMGGGAE